MTQGDNESYICTQCSQLVLLPPLRWCCVNCIIHHEGDVREGQKYMWREQAIMEWSWWVASNNACEPGEQLIVLVNGEDKSDLVRW